MTSEKLLQYFFLICSVAVFGNAAKAQPVSQYSGLSKYIGEGMHDVRDSAKIRITYSLNYVPDSTRPQQILKDRKVLLIGDNRTHFYSYYVRQSDSAYTADSDRGRDFVALKRPADVRGEGYEIFKMHATGKQTVLESITNLSLYKYEEDDALPQWTILEDTCTVLSYTCQKATTRFRGRDWTVWFSTAIPVNAGPWKLRGLPGLILKAADSRNHYVFECIGIEQLRQKKQPIITPRFRRSGFIDCSREEYRKAQKQFYENYINALLALGFNIIVEDDAGKTIETLATPNKEFEERNFSWWMSVNVADRHKKIPYNPIELE
jgi:GLPGLI family protein